MTATEIVSCTLAEKVATVTLQREKSLNALDGQLLEALSQTLHRLAIEEVPADRCRVVVLRGAGDRAFVAGADIRWMRGSDPDAIRSFLHLGQRVMRELELFPCPVVSVIQGIAFGGGLELALAGDLIVAADSARLGQPEVKLGLIPGFGGTQRLTLRVGIGGARLLVLTGDEIAASDAYRLGLVDVIAPIEQLEPRIAQLVQSLTARAPLAVRAAKQTIGKLHQDAELAGLQCEIESFLDVFRSQDAVEGISAFLEKRAATFCGK